VRESDNDHQDVVRDRVEDPVVTDSDLDRSTGRCCTDDLCVYNERMEEATSIDAAVVGVRELKNRLSAHLDRVKRGEELMVTERGRPIARLIPVGADVERMTALVEAGIVRPPRGTARRLPVERVKLAGSSSLDADVADQRR